MASHPTRLAQQGHWAIAPDWIGFGCSDKPDVRDFAYTPTAFLAALAEFVQALGLDRFYLVLQGYVGTVGLRYALQQPNRVERLVVLNAPLSPTAKLPWKLKQISLPLLGEVLTQDPLLVDRTLEGGSRYVVTDGDLDIYRKPFLLSSAAGRSLLATLRHLELANSLTAIQSELADWPQPTLLIWGMNDPWLPIAVAEAAVKILAKGELVRLAEFGHYPQEHA